MLTIKLLPDNTFEIRISGKLQEQDFENARTQMEPLLNAVGNVKLLIDARDFAGWENTDAAQKHFAFVRDHHKRIDRIAVIAGHEWQHWIVSFAGIFVHPDIKVFDKDQSIQAETWLRWKQAA